MKLLKKYKGILISIFIIASIIGIFVWAFSTRPVVKEEAPKKQEKVLDYIGNTITEEKDGKKSWELKADKITIDPKTQIATLNNLHGKYYENDGTVLEITAPLATYNQNNKDLKMSGNILITNNSDLSFSAENVFFNNKDKKFIGTGNINITRGNIKASADKIESNNNFTDFKLQGNAHIIKEN